MHREGRRDQRDAVHEVARKLQQAIGEMLPDSDKGAGVRLHATCRKRLPRRPERHGWSYRRWLFGLRTYTAFRLKSVWFSHTDFSPTRRQCQPISTDRRPPDAVSGIVTCPQMDVAEAKSVRDGTVADGEIVPVMRRASSPATGKLSDCGVRKPVPVPRLGLSGWPPRGVL